MAITVGRDEYRDDLTQLRTDVAARVLREVYTADQRALDFRVSTLEKQVPRLADEVGELEKRRVERGVNKRRYLVASVVLPAVAIAVTVLLFVIKP